MTVEEIFIRFRTNLASFNKELLRTPKQFKNLETKTGQLSQRFDRLGRIGQKLGRNFRFITNGFKGFRMELLSVMFGAQMVAGAMWGLLKPAMQAVGIFDIWGAILTIVFLPVAMFLLKNVFIPMLNFFQEHPTLSKFIGFFVLFAAILFTVVAVGAALVLFAGGLILAFAVASGIAAAFGVTLGVLVLIIVGIGLAIVGLAIVLFDFFKNWDKIWGWIKEKASAAWNWLAENVWKPIASWFDKWIIQPIRDAFNWIVENVWKPVAGWFNQWVIDPIKSAWDGLVDKIKAGWEFIKGIFVAGEGEIYTPGAVTTGGGGGGGTSNTNFAPVTNITVNASSNVDTDMMFTQLSNQTEEQFRNLGGR